MTPDSPETLALLDEARQGKAEAVEQLLAQHRDGLKRRINLRLDPALAARLDASDVVQDVLLEASRRLKDYLQGPTMPFHLWLQLIADDHVIDAWRRHRQAKRRSLDREQPMAPRVLNDRSSVELAAQLLGHELTPATAAIQQELQRRVEEAIGGMSADDQEIIQLKHYQQFSNQEIARILGLSEAAASMRYLRALRRLKAALTSGPESIR
jgi:RNA polymerase sigma-70 factor (ECF subfamily)